MSGKGYLYSHVFKPITTVCRQVTMRGITCTIDEVELVISMTMVGWAEVMLIKTMEIWRKGGWVSKLWSYNINWQWGSTNKGVEMQMCVNIGGHVNQNTGDRGRVGSCGSPRWRQSINWLGAAHAFVAANNRAEFCNLDNGLSTD